MTPDQKDLVIVLSAVSAASELFGTFTVLRSFRRTAKVAEEIRTALAPSVTAMGIVIDADSYLNQAKLTSLVRSIADKIGWDPWTFAGLLAYVVGAGFGLWAAILAVRS